MSATITPIPQQTLEDIVQEVERGCFAGPDTPLGDDILKLVTEYGRLYRAYAKTLGDDGKVERYREFVGIYNDFCHAHTGVAARMSVAAGKALKICVKTLLTNKEVAAAPDPTQAALDVWAAVLANWDKLSPWMQSQFALPKLAFHLPEILSKLRTHAHPQQPAKPAQQAAHTAAARAYARKQQRDGAG